MYGDPDPNLGDHSCHLYEVWEVYGDLRGSWGVAYMMFGKCMGTPWGSHEDEVVFSRCGCCGLFMCLVLNNQACSVTLSKSLSPPLGSFMRDNYRKI